MFYLNDKKNKNVLIPEIIKKIKLQKQNTVKYE